MSKFLSPLLLELTDEFEGLWEVKMNFAYESDLGGIIVVPEGFMTDLASVPRIPAAYLLFGDRGQKAAVIHDWLYSTRAYERRVCDNIFLEALALSGYNWFTRNMMYLGVRAGGGWAWKDENVPQPDDVEQYMDHWREGA